MRILLLALALVVADPAHAATIHIVAFGDSMTAGYLVPAQDAYPAQLQKVLREKGHEVEVRNAGINGDTTAHALQRFDEAIAPGTDIAIVEFGLNDQRQHVPVDTIHSRLGEIIRSMRARHIQVLVIGFRSLDLSAVAKANDVPYQHWALPPGKYRARDGAHFNAEGYAILVRQMLPTIEALMARAAVAR